jgi:diphthine methyl ester acylhydrolase
LHHENMHNTASWVILASCMHAGTRVLRIVMQPNGSWSLEVIAKFEEHKSMNYGSDTQINDNRKMSIISTSFYDRLVCLWDLEI